VLVERTEVIGEYAGEADVECAVKQEVDVISKEIVKPTDSSLLRTDSSQLNDSDKLKRPKRKKKKYVNRHVTDYCMSKKLHHFIFAITLLNHALF